MRKAYLIILCCFFIVGAGRAANFNFNSLGVKDGLPDNYIHAMMQDSYGFMWFVYANGVSRYDGYNFKNYQFVPTGNDIYSINEDLNRNIWIKAGTSYFIYDREKDCIEDHISPVLEGLNINSDIELLSVDHDQNLWISIADTLIYHDYLKNRQFRFVLPAGGIIKCIECRNGKAYVLFHDGKVYNISFEEGKILYKTSVILSTYLHHKMYLDYTNKLWFYTAHSPDDVLQYFNSETEKVQVFLDSNNESFSFVTTLIDDGKGNIWIGTDNEGVTILNSIDNAFSQIKYDPQNPFSIPSNHIKCFYHDAQEIMWVGTSKRGIGYAALENSLFQRNNVSNKDDISCILEDHSGNLWFGSDGEGITKVDILRFKQTVFNYKNGGIPENLVVCSFIDSKGKIWVGTYGGGVCYFDGEKFVGLNFENVDGEENPLLYVRSIEEDVAGNIWIGTVTKGLFCYGMDGTFSRYTIDNTQLQSNSITDLYCQQGQEMYIGTSAGGCIMDTYSRKIQRLSEVGDSEHDIANSYVNCVFRDSRNLVWIGGKQGVTILNESTGASAHLTTDNGLSHNFVRAIIEDENKNIWLTSDYGITNIVVINNPRDAMSSFRCYRYYDEDGIGDIAFNNHSILCLRNGEILMGGIGGYIRTSPNSVPKHRNKSKIEFTAMYIANKRVDVGEPANGGRIILDKNIQLLKEITLDYSNNNFALDVSALDYKALHKTKFAYRLDDSDWVNFNGNTIYFNKLSPGSYNLQVKLMTPYESWNSTPTSLLINIKPPFWLSATAYLIYLILIGLAAAFIIVYVRRKSEMKMQMQKLEMDIVKRHEMDEAKMRFFTNVSHDLRTPLSLIITPLEKLMSSSNFEKKAENDLKLMHRNALILMSEVNQLLDLRKLERGKSDLNLSHGNLSDFLKDLCNSFQPYSIKKGIQLKMVSTSSIEMDFDRNKIQRVFMNLLSNAFKFNVEDGQVTVTIKRISTQEGEFALIEVADTGIGVLVENRDLIFERFFQESNSSTYIGSGIGLHIAKEYVTMHGGSIQVKGNSPRGTVFSVLLPIVVSSEKEEVYSKEDVIEAAEVEPEDLENPILVVEDNDDFRQFIVDCLKDHYKVISAPDGKRGLEMMIHQQVKMVISDIMMPVMDGLELCNKIKGDIRFSHIPVILLTARTTDEHILDGLKEGADEYITKPFNVEILLLRIKKLLEWSLNNHRKFQMADIEPSEITISSLDEKLIEEAIRLVEENMDNQEFSVEDLSSAIGMSRGHLYKKLMNITGKSPLEFIRTIRVKRGKQLIEKSQMNISEVAYSIGLSPKQFSKYFKEQYGELPSMWQKFNG